MEALLTAIVLWLAANFDIPENYQHPQIIFASSEEISAVRHHHILAATGAKQRNASHAPAETQGHNDIVAIYVDATRTIYLTRDWTGESPEDLSVLVHEMVHHLQNMGEVRHACAQEREKLAFAAQERWLRMFGTNLEEAFGIDGFSLILHTNCAH